MQSKTVTRERSDWSADIRCDRCGDLHKHGWTYTWWSGRQESVCLACGEYDGDRPDASAVLDA